MLNIDFQEHNAKVKDVWKTFEQGKPIKVPVTLDITVRSIIMDKRLNVQNITWKDYLEDKDVMWETQLRTQEWIRFHVLEDKSKGIPSSWPIFVDFQNVFEEMWWGAELFYGTEPNTRQLLTDDKKNLLFERGIPDAFDGIGGTAVEYYEYFRERAKSDTYLDRPVHTAIGLPGLLSTDGPFTVACGLRGVGNFMADMLEDPDYAIELMDMIATGAISRIKKTRAYLGKDELSDGLWFADDAIAMISPGLYEDMILPIHKRLIKELTIPGSKQFVHLCGDSQRFFPIMERELNAGTIDTGFPIDFSRLYDELSPKTRVMGGPNIALLRNGTPQQIEEEVKRILHSGVMEKSKAFILRDANLVAPCTPLENINMIYEACEKYGYYH